MKKQLTAQISYPLIIFGIQFLKFMIAGLPAFVLAILLNFILVKEFQMNYSIAYAIVLINQTILNFFLCRMLVFKRNANKNIYIQFYQFVSGILIFRILDWAFYSLLMIKFGKHFLWFQILNVIIFSIVKYQFSKFIMK